MANLIYYHQELILFQQAYGTNLNSEKAEIIYNKLIRHFKLKPTAPRLEFTNRINGGIYDIKYQVIRLRHITNYGILCHEIAHHIQYRKYGKIKRWHTKQHTKIMKRLIQYCAKKNYWGVPVRDEETSPQSH